MLHCSKRLPHGSGLALALIKRAATIELDWDVRQKSRFDATDSSGRAIGSTAAGSQVSSTPSARTS